MFGGTMNIEEIVKQIDGEISKLQQARSLLLGADAPIKKGPGRPKAIPAVAKVAAPKGKRVLSAAGRARISAALKKRWAEKRKTVGAVKKAVPAKAVAAKKVAVKKSAKKATGPVTTTNA
jgi:hypothetical protein